MAAEEARYRIDDLARAAGTTARNVRAYQERGLLPPPTARAGRAGIYDDSHLARLRLIDALLQRGFTTAHIADFITSWETGKDLTEVLGLQYAVTAQWSQEEPVEVSRELLTTVLGAHPNELVEKLCRLDLVRIDGDTVTITDTRLLARFTELQEYGVDPGTLISVYAEVATRIDEISGILVRAAKKYIVDEHGPGWLPGTNAEIAGTTRMLNTMRELGVAAVHSGLARSLDATLAHELGDYLATAAERERARWTQRTEHNR